MTNYAQSVTKRCPFYMKMSGTSIVSVMVSYSSAVKSTGIGSFTS